jgi:secretion/DNA translocation related TadE-like protein
MTRPTRRATSPEAVGGRERGSATPMVAAACAVIIIVGAAAGVVVAAAVAASRARVAADLSALAGAGALVTALGAGSGPACEVSAEVAARNGAELVSCRIDDSVNVTVEVSVTLETPLPWSAGPAVAAARAGPRPAEPAG